ncbi:MAG: lipid A deacylase LpxR family protein [Alphaproteobacteria bacterium]|nr:lipid A deacylase LpxR family protein [Alphaproteobacteria bacterium]
MQKSRLLLLALIVSVCHPACAAAQTPADTSGRLIVMEDNDKFASHDDRHYTQGLRVAYVSAPLRAGGDWDGVYNWLAGNMPVFRGADRKREYEWTILGQSIFTPTDTAAITPSHLDRPYAAWLYTGIGLLQDTDRGAYHTLENAELLLGVVGPAALGGVTQNDFHQFIGVSSALGWENQLHNEPAILASYERKWRFEHPVTENLSADVIPELGATVGNVLTYGDAGGVVRFGHNLAADYGPDRIRPGLSGTGWFDAAQMKGKLGWYVFLGMQGRVVGHNIFLDGNTMSASPSVDKKTLVADFVGGASVFWSSSVRLDFTVTQRTREFYGQQGHPDRFGGIDLAFRL